MVPFGKTAIMIVLQLFFALLAAGIVTSEAENSTCDPGFADSCYSSVHGDLDTILGLSDGVGMNISLDGIEDLCISLDDAFNCTGDIIDADCSQQEGRDKFDSWLVALWQTSNYVCKDLKKFQNILGNARCWNPMHFLDCIMEKGSIGHIRDLLHTELDEAECKKLKPVFEGCMKEATASFCPDFTDMHDVIQVFLHNSYCSSKQCILGSFRIVMSSVILIFSIKLL